MKAPAIAPSDPVDRRRRTALKTLAAVPLTGFPAVGRAAVPAVRIGYALPLSGPLAHHAQVAQQRSVQLWLEQIHAGGGLLVKGVRRPIDLIGYDDRGAPDLTAHHYLRLMTVDKVDLILAPFSSDATFAVAPLANKYGYPLLAPTGISRKLIDMRHPYFFSLVEQPDKIMGALVELMASCGVRSIGVLYLDDFFGTESLSGLRLALRGTPIEMSIELPYVPEGPDLSGQLKAIAASGAEGFIGLTGPDATFSLVAQARKVSFDRKLLYAGVGTAGPDFRAAMGKAAEGVLGTAAWSPKSGAAAKAFYDAYVNRFGSEPDRWSAGFAYAGMQILQEAVAYEGLNRSALRQYIGAHSFHTIVGLMQFAGSENASMSGAVGQWQNGEFEIVWPPARATASMVFPKAAWS
jgi:branched-chain amino acid transport system substrate-binding protein